MIPCRNCGGWGEIVFANAVVSFAFPCYLCNGWGFEVIDRMYLGENDLGGEG